MLALIPFLLTALIPSTALAEPPDEEQTLFVGGQLAVTAEPFEDGGTAVSLNVLPVVVEWAATPRLGVRVVSMLNLQFAGPDAGFAHRGGGLTLPVYLPRKKDTAPYEGFYIGPYSGFTVNPLVGGWDLTMAGEVGVRWEVFPRWTVNLAGQLGASWLERPAADDSQWVNHFGVFPSIGFWVL